MPTRTIDLGRDITISQLPTRRLVAGAAVAVAVVGWPSATPASAATWATTATKGLHLVHATRLGRPAVDAACDSRSV